MISARSSGTSIEVATIDDLSWCEDFEYLQVDISNIVNSQTLSLSSAVTIVENDLPTFNITNSNITEGSKALFEIEISQACPNLDIQVDWMPIGVTALVNSDYEETSGTLTISKGTLKNNFSVQTVDDSDFESNEFFTIGLMNQTHSFIQGSTIGRGIIQDNDIPTTVGVTKLSKGYAHTCALLSNGKVKCWGNNYRGIIGIVDNTTGDGTGEMGDSLTDLDLGTGLTYLQISQANDFSCVLANHLGVNKVKCWGYNSGSYGHLGVDVDTYYDQTRGDNPNELGDNQPFINLASDAEPIKITSGSHHSCALFDNGKVKCWGYAEYGQLGYENRNSINDDYEMGSNLPYVDFGTGRTVKDISSRGETNCAILDNDLLKCWGDGNSGKRGSGDTSDIGDEIGDMGDNLAYVDLGLGITVKKVAVGYTHTCAILNDDTVKCWGDGYYGRLGTGNTNDLGDNPGEMGDTLPIVDLGAGRTAKEITLHEAGTCAILDNNDLKCWGYTGYGQAGQEHGSTIGDGASEMGDNLLPINLGTGRYATQVKAYYQSVCAILDNSDLKCWGYNDRGQLGYGSTENIGNEAGEMGDSLPAIDLGTGKVASKLPNQSGGDSPCVILTDNTIRCWGDATNGQIGLENYIGDKDSEMGDSLPYLDFGTSSTIIDIAAGYYHSCALFSDGKVKCWGDNYHGRLGYETNKRGFPDGPNQMGDNLAFVDLGTDLKVIKITIGDEHSCALFDNQKVKCWGYGYDGQLGYENNSTLGDSVGEMGDSLPFVDIGTDRKILDLTSGDNHNCVLLDDLTIKCWGYNGSGQLGLGDSSIRGNASGDMGDNLPEIDLGTGRKVMQVLAIDDATCAILDNQDLKCWGAYVRLGLGDRNNRGNEAGEMGDNLPAVNLGTDLKAIKLPKSASTANHMCVVVTGNQVKCWGYNDYGQLGQGHNSSRGYYPDHMGDYLNFTYIADDYAVTDLVLSRDGSCAILNNQKVKCWGRNHQAQAGVGHNSNIGDGPNEMNTLLEYANIFETTPTQDIGGFTISGISGGLDTTDDEWLKNDIPTATWSDASGATSYDVTIYEYDMINIKCGTQNTAGNSFVFIGCPLVEGETYLIDVIASDGSGAINYPFNNYYAFTVDESAPDTFNILGVTGALDTAVDATLTDGNIPFISWEASIGSDQYQITIFEDDGTTVKCATEIVNAGTMTHQMNCSLNNLTDYKIEMDAFDLAGNSANALNQPFSFSVFEENAPSTFNITGVTGGEDIIKDNQLTFGSWPTINWNDSDGEDRYDVTIYEDDNTTIKCATESAVIDSEQLSFPHCDLDPSTTYVGHVYAIDSLSSIEADNSPYTFHTAATTLDSFYILGIQGGSDVTSDDQLTSGNTPHVYWEASSGATNYKISIWDISETVNICSEQSTAGTDYNLSNCYLVPGSSYKVKLNAYDIGENFIAAYNNNYLFSVNSSYPIATINNPTVTEGANLAFTVTLSDAWSEEVSLLWKAIPVSASIGLDYTYASGTITIPAAQTVDSTSIIISTIDDTIVEFDEKIIVSLTNPQNAKVTKESIGLGTIADNDAGIKTTKIASGSNAACALTSEGKVKCWGATHNGRLGREIGHIGWQPGQMGDNLEVVDLGAGLSAVEIANSEESTCAVLSGPTGVVRCWGRDYYNQLGFDAVGSDGFGYMPNTMGDNLTSLSFSNPIITLKAGRRHYCALLDNGSLQCWGLNNYGQLGLGDTSERDVLTPAYVDLGVGRTATEISVGEYHSCAILDNGEMKCWGNNSNGQLGLEHANRIGDESNEMGDNLPAIDLGTDSGYDFDEIDGLPTANLYLQATYENRGWDFTNTWEINEGISYPQLQTTADDNSCADGTFYNDYGDGSIDDPYLICNPSQLNDISTNGCNDITTTACDKNFKLAQNITMTGTFTPIGSYSNSFSGVFDGNSKTIFDLTINSSSDYAAFISALDTTGIIKQITFDNITVTSTGDYIAAVVGSSSGLIENIIADVNISGNQYVSAVAAENMGTIYYTAVTGAISGNSNVEAIFAAESSGTYSGNLWDETTTAIPAANAYTASMISTGLNFSCAVIAQNGKTKCWGYNGAYSGILGHDENYDERGERINEMGNHLPYTELGTALTVSKITSGTYHTCALFTNGRIKCWGDNDDGELGLGHTSARGNYSNHMGDYLQYVDLGVDGVQDPLLSDDLELGYRFGCAVLSTTGELKCWGNNEYATLGSENIISYGSGPDQLGDNLPIVNLGTGRTVSTLSNLGAYSFHNCVILDNGDTKCWGNNFYGRLGHTTSSMGVGNEPNEMGANLPYVDLGTGITAKDIEFGLYHACAILSDDSVKCWGAGQAGRSISGYYTDLGDIPGDMGDNLPFALTDPTKTPLKISLGTEHTCILNSDFTVNCYGYNSEGQLGYGNTSYFGDSMTEVGNRSKTVDLGLNRHAISISSGISHTCAVLDNYETKCWGRNYYGQLGLEDNLNRGDEPDEMGDNLPYIDLGEGKKVIQVSAGDQMTCAILDDQSIKCWGYNNYYYQLGIGAPSQERIGNEPGEMGDNLPALQLGSGIKATEIISSTYYSSVCAMFDNLGIMEAKCWGRNDYGQLGQQHTSAVGDDIDDIELLTPINLGTGKTPIQLTGRSSSKCAILDDQTLKCWGRNYLGELGNEGVDIYGNTTDSMGDFLPTVNLGL